MRGVGCDHHRAPDFFRKNKRKSRIGLKAGERAPNIQPYRYRYRESKVDNTDFDSIEKKIGIATNIPIQTKYRIGLFFRPADLLHWVMTVCGVSQSRRISPMDLRESPYRKKEARPQQDSEFSTPNASHARMSSREQLLTRSCINRIASLHDTISSREPAARERLGVPTMGGKQCEHCCGAETFKGESIGIGCKNGKDALLLRLPALQELRALQLCYI